MNTLYEDPDLCGPLKKHIRLLNIENVSRERLEISMRKVKLSSLSKTPFKAVSYTWRSPLRRNDKDKSEDDPSCPILCKSPNGTEYELKIFGNLHDALRQLGRSEYRSDSFWIDYICINQADNAELSLQVGRMAYFYDQADGAIFWLGRADQYLDQAEKLMRRLCAQSGDTHQWEKINPEGLDTPTARRILGEECQNMDYWKALAHFFNRTWFSRAWVVQEVLLSQKLTKKPVVLCGDKVFNWEDLTRVSAYLSKSLWKQKFTDPEFLGFEKGDTYSIVTSHHGPAKLAAAQKDLDKGSMDTFLHFLIRIREYDCSKPEDKVYSLYSIAKKHMALDREIKLLDVSYDKSVRDIYIDATEIAWKTSEELHFLAHVESVQDPIHSLPSWVPDWSISDKMGLAITGYRRYDAGGDLQKDPQYLLENRAVLKIQAACLDTISATGELKKDGRAGFPLCMDLLCGLNNAQLGTSKHIFEAFWRTLIRDTDESGECPAGAYWHLDDSFCAWVIKMTTRKGDERSPACLLDALVNVHQASRPDLRAELERLAKSNESLREFLMRTPSTDGHCFDLAYSYRENLQVFRTAHGYLGLGTHALKKHDTIWIMPGSRVPLIMRSVPGKVRYRLVGGAYVHGVMKGEALSGAILGQPKDWFSVEIE